MSGACLCNFLFLCIWFNVFRSCICCTQDDAILMKSDPGHVSAVTFSLAVFIQGAADHGLRDEVLSGSVLPFVFRVSVSVCRCYGCLIFRMCLVLFSLMEKTDVG